MSERPILFSAPMVHAILDGCKTQTRRIVKPQPKVIHAEHSDASITTERIFRSGDQRIHCPYGQPGDRLWVRETHFCPGGKSPFADWRVWYRADSNNVPVTKWTPSIFMPRWASRITLEITGVRVERLQEITEEDAKAEAALPFDDSPMRYRTGFQILWTQINAHRAPWASNPWVWVIEFRRMP